MTRRKKRRNKVPLPLPPRRQFIELKPQFSQTETKVPYQCVLFPAKPKFSGLVNFKTSLDWAPKVHSKKNVYAVPFISKLGLITTAPLGYWKCEAKQLLCTIVSTIFQRLKNRMRKVLNSKRFHASLHLLFKAAALYGITNNEYMFSRFTEVLKRNIGIARKLLYSQYKNMDADKRFTYGQILQEILWLQSRESSPRAKSIICTEEPEFRSFTKCNFEPHGSIRNFLNCWSKVYFDPAIKTRLTYLTPYLHK